MPHFLDLDSLSSHDIRGLLTRAQQLKADRRAGIHNTLLEHTQLAMLFEKPSTRTRASFEAGIYQLGGRAVVLNAQQTQMGRGETIADTARVLARYVDMIMIRCFSHATLLALAEYAKIPVINGLTDHSHPCQIMADILTFEEHRGTIAGKIVTWVGDGNNVTHSWIHAAAQLGFTLKIATPRQLQPSESVLAWARARNAKVEWMVSPEEAATDSDLITTDTWVSMGDADVEFRHKLLDPYQVNAALMARAKKDALFMHCLPAHRGEEVTEEIIDGPQSVIFDEAENRLHVQKAIMLWCMGK